MARTQTRPWDPAEHLETEEDMAAYLNVALEEGDLSLIMATLGDIARARRIALVAQETGLGRESLYKSLSPDGNPEFATVLKVVRALGLRLQVATASGATGEVNDESLRAPLHRSSSGAYRRLCTLGALYGIVLALSQVKCNGLQNLDRATTPARPGRSSSRPGAASGWAASTRSWPRSWASRWCSTASKRLTRHPPSPSSSSSWPSTTSRPAGGSSMRTASTRSSTCVWAPGAARTRSGSGWTACRTPAPR